jgi:RimJ/RimL family protein N-acetyltransferase
MADCFEANVAVVAVLRKLGMRRQPGRLREWLRGLGYRELRPALRHSVGRDTFVSSHL